MMANIEREIKIIKVDVKKVKKNLERKGIKPKWQYIQDIYTFDLPRIEIVYSKAVEQLINNNDARLLKKLINDIKPCFDIEDIEAIKRNTGYEDILDYIKNSDEYLKLNNEELIDIMIKSNDNYSKWVRMRKTGDETTITIKKIISSKGVYGIDDVNELEFDIPSIEFGKEFLSDLGYFFDRHQSKMRIAYDYKNTEIVIDKWPFLEPYIEVEGKNENDILEVVSDLGFNKEEALIINTDDLYNEKGIDVYSEKYSDLSFSKIEKEEIKKYMGF